MLERLAPAEHIKPTINVGGTTIHLEHLAKVLAAKAEQRLRGHVPEST